MPSSLLKIISFLGLALTILPSLFVFGGVIEMKTHYILMAVGMFMWFGSAPFWMHPTALEEVEEIEHEEPEAMGRGV